MSKTAIASAGDSPEALIDSRFGRCAYFAIYDSQTKSVEYIPNTAKDAEEGAGPAAVQLLASRQVTKIVSSEFGIKIKPMLDSLKIQMIVIKEANKSIRQIIDLLNH